MPQRVQLHRRKGWRLPPNTIVVARPTRWGNPFRLGEHGDAATCVRRYRAWLLDNAQRGREPNPASVHAQLAGRDLACWCAPDQPCHADVLLEMANP